MTLRAWLLFAVMSVVWGVPYLFIKEAVDSISPAAVVAGRTLIGGLLLLPFALRAGALRPALRVWPWVLAFGAIEMAGPFLLLGFAEQTLTSGVTGLLVSTVPLFAAGIALVRGDRGVLHPLRLLGLLIGFAGVVVVVAGPELAISGAEGLGAVGMVLLVGLMYSIAPFIMASKLRDVPSLGSITIALLSIGAVYLVPALLTQQEVPTTRSLAALGALGVISTAIAFLAFFALVKEAGPTRAPLFTYVNPVVAIALGALVLAEPVTPGLLIGFPLIIAGCWLAATGGRMRPQEAAAPS